MNKIILFLIILVIEIFLDKKFKNYYIGQGEEIKMLI